jgi:hypothetical protein
MLKILKKMKLQAIRYQQYKCTLPAFDIVGQPFVMNK